MGFEEGLAAHTVTRAAHAQEHQQAPGHDDVERESGFDPLLVLQLRIDKVLSFVMGDGGVSLVFSSPE